MKHPQTKHNFSLIELLITIAVIAILAGLLLPALNSARAKAHAIACANNLKQLGLAQLNYATDSEDYYVPDLTENNVYWWETLVRQRYIPPTKGYNGTYSGGSSQELRFPIPPLLCPAEQHSATTWGNDDVARMKATDYGMAYFLSHDLRMRKNDPIDLFGRLTEFKHSSKVFLAGDRYWHSMKHINPNNQDEAVRDGMMRHNQGMNMLFIDGHVSRIAKNRYPTWVLFTNASKWLQWGDKRYSPWSATKWLN